MEMLPPFGAARPWSFLAYQEGGRTKIYPTEGRKVGRRKRPPAMEKSPIIGSSSKSQGMDEVHHYLIDKRAPWRGTKITLTSMTIRGLLITRINLELLSDLAGITMARTPRRPKSSGTAVCSHAREHLCLSKRRKPAADIAGGILEMVGLQLTLLEV